MAYTVWGWSVGRFSPGDVVVVNTLLAQLFRPLDMLGMVYRTIRQGLIDMEAMFIWSTPRRKSWIGQVLRTSRSDAARSGSRMSPSLTIPNGRSCMGWT
jgi:ABC-type multidrug transport system fused ATPase/permease subunit